MACGRVQTLYYKRPFEFRSLDQLLLIIDDVLDSVDFEKDPADLRRLYGEDEAGHLVFQRFNMEDVYTEEDIINRKYENPFKGELVISYGDTCAWQTERQYAGGSPHRHGNSAFQKLSGAFADVV